MALVLALAALIWGGAWGLGVPRAIRVALIALLLFVVILLHLTLPAEHPIREATGGGAALWIGLILGAIAVRGYGILLSWLRSKAADLSKEAASITLSDAPFSDQELQRYARHIVLREIGGTGQTALKNAAVLVVGAGGLGAPALQYLAGAGVGTIGVIDDDLVDNSNLQRQVIHTVDRIGLPKVQSVQLALSALNPDVDIKPYNRRLTPDIAADLIAEYDLVLDGTDNFDTRYLINETCAQAGIPLISAALTQWEGQISLYDPAQGTPCYNCIFPQRPDPSLVPSCAEGGVLGPLPGVIGSMMAVEAVKAITGAGEGLRGRMLIYDALYGETRIIAMKPRDDCDVCAKHRA